MTKPNSQNAYTFTINDPDDGDAISLPEEILSDPCVVGYLWQQGDPDPSAWPGAELLGHDSVWGETGIRILARMPDAATATMARLQTTPVPREDWTRALDEPVTSNNSSIRDLLDRVRAQQAGTETQPPPATPCDIGSTLQNLLARGQQGSGS